MKRTDFIKSLGVLPAVFLLPPVLQGEKSDMQIWCGGFWGSDKSLTVGGCNEVDEQFIITYRKLHSKIMVPSYENWEKHFKPNLKSRKYPKNYGEAARSDWFYKEMSNRMRDNQKRFPFNDGFSLTKEDTNRKGEYYTRMAEWCERMAKQFRSVK